MDYSILLEEFEELNSSPKQIYEKLSYTQQVRTLIFTFKID